MGVKYIIPQISLRRMSERNEAREKEVDAARERIRSSAAFDQRITRKRREAAGRVA
jgi:hypothetical protein